MSDIKGDCFFVTGPILVGNASMVNLAGIDALADGVKTVDISGLTEVDSSSIAVLLSWLREAKSKNFQLAITNIPDSVRSLAAVYDVAEFLP